MTGEPGFPGGRIALWVCDLLILVFAIGTAPLFLWATDSLGEAGDALSLRTGQ